MISIKAKLRGTSEYSHEIQDKKVVLPISVGQAYHEGDKLIATIELLNNRFSSCDIIVADTLQRKNLDIKDINDLENLDEFKNGSSWIERNKKSFFEFKIPYTIIRWNECLSNPEFSKKLNELKILYESDISYRECLENDISQLLQRKKDSDFLEQDKNKQKKISISYFLEETAVFLSYFLDKKYDIVLYPSNIPSSLAYVREKFIKPFHRNLLENLSINFKKRSSVV